MFCVKKSFLKKFRKFYKIAPVLESLFNKATGLKACNLRPATLLQTDSNRGVFLSNLRNFSEHWRSSFLEVFCRSCCSALINAVMKYSFSTSFVQSWKVLHGNLLKITLHHSYFSKNFTIVAEQRYWKMYLDGCFWGRFYFGNIPAWLLLKSSCRLYSF